MPNQVQYDGNAYLTGSADRLFNQGMTNIQGVADRYAGRVKNRAINELLKSGAAEGENADAYSSRIGREFAGIEGVDPLTALQLRNVASKPVYEREAKELAAEQYENQQAIEGYKINRNIENDLATQEHRSNILTGQQTDREATAGYRTSSLTNQSTHNANIDAHNKRMEVPTDIREATQAGYPTGERTTAGPDGEMGTDDDIVKKYLTKKDFALYQKDKAKARFSQRELDPSTVSKNNQMAFKYAIETQLGKDTKSRKEYDDLKPGEKAILFNQFKESGVINFGRTQEGFWGDSYGIGKTPPPSTNKSTEEKTIVKRYSDGSVKYSDGTTGTE